MGLENGDEVPLLVGAGGAVLAPLLSRRWVAAAAVAAPLAVGLVAAPLALPLLPERAFLAWQARLGIAEQPLERQRQGALPQIFADQHGWPELARAVARAADALPPAERATAAVYGQNYGEAAAVDVLGRALGLGLPPAISGHNQFWLWGVPEGRGDPLLVVGDEGEDCGGAYRERVRAAEVPPSPWVMPYEDARVIWICRGRTAPLDELWRRVRLFI